MSDENEDDDSSCRNRHENDDDLPRQVQRRRDKKQRRGQSVQCTGRRRRKRSRQILLSWEAFLVTVVAAAVAALPLMATTIQGPSSHHVVSAFVVQRVTTRRCFTPTAATTSQKQQQLLHHQEAFLSTRTTGFCLYMSAVEEESSSRSTSSSSSTLSSSISVTDRFHADMQRVLESRRQMLFTQQQQQQHGNTNSASTTTVGVVEVDRNQKPILLETDVDGAQRVHGLLKVLCQRQLATERSFQIVMQAYVARGRYRWRTSSSLITNTTTETEEEIKHENDHEIHDALVPKENNNSNNDTNQTSVHATSSPPPRKVICAADQVEALWQELVQYQGPATPLSMETYNLVLQAYANCATPRASEHRNYAKRAQALYDRLVAMYRGAIPVSTTLHVLHATAWQQANLQPGKYAVQADKYLQQVRQHADANPSILLSAYRWTLEAFSKSGSPGGARRADELLQEMIQINATASNTTTNTSGENLLNAQDYSNAVLAWSKAHDEVDAAARAQAWLETMIQLHQAGKFPAGSEPPLIAFNGVIVAWSRQGDYSRAAAVLWLLDQVSKTCVDLQADVVSYNSVLHAYFRAKAPIVKAMQLVQFMHQHAEAQPLIRPNSFTYYTYLKCLLMQNQPQQQHHNNNKHAVDVETIMLERDDMLQRLEACWLRGDYEMEPTNRIFNMVINSYAKSNDRRAWRKAMHLLERMRAMSLSTESEHLSAVRPDTITITSVMECLSKASDPQAPQLAQSLLEDAFDRYHDTQDVNDRPNLRTFTMAILTLAKNHGSVVEARRLLDNLIELHKETGDPSLKPNAYPYNYVLNCAASTSTSDDPGEAFQIATRTFQDLRQAGLADSFSYAFWIKCCIHLVRAQDVKLKCVRYAFEECKRQGLVTAEVLKRLFQAVPRHIVLNEMLEGKVSMDHQQGQSSYTPVSVKELPKSWTRKTPKSWK